MVGNNHSWSRRGLLAKTAAGAALPFISGTVSGKSNQNITFNPYHFEEVYEFLTEYRDMKKSERKTVEDTLHSEEIEVLTDVHRPVSTTHILISQTKPGLSDIFIIARDSTSKKDDIFRKWGWSTDTLVELIRNDEVEELSLNGLQTIYGDRTLHDKQIKNEIRERYPSPEDHVDGTESGSYIIEKENLGRFSTAFRWEHEIEYDVEHLVYSPPAGDRVSNIRTFSNPLHTTWFLSYDGVLEENIWKNTDQWGDDPDLYDEYYHSYKQSKFSQTLPVIGVSHYIAYPYSEMVGSAHNATVREYGIND